MFILNTARKNGIMLVDATGFVYLATEMTVARKLFTIEKKLKSIKCKTFKREN